MFEPIIDVWDMTHADEVVRPVTGGVVQTLNSRMGTGGNQVTVVGYGSESNTEIANALLAKANLSYRMDMDNLAVNTFAIQRSDEYKTSTIASRDYKSATDLVTNTGYRVRRLTPTECLRLQGLPDWWLDDIPNNSDTAKYKAIGNGMAQPCPNYVIGNIAEVLNVKR